MKLFRFSGHFWENADFTFKHRRKSRATERRFQSIPCGPCFQFVWATWTRGTKHYEFVTRFVTLFYSSLTSFDFDVDIIIMICNIRLKKCKTFCIYFVFIPYLETLVKLYSNLSYQNKINICLIFDSRNIKELKEYQNWVKIVILTFSQKDSNIRVCFIDNVETIEAIKIISFNA